MVPLETKLCSRIAGFSIGNCFHICYTHTETHKTGLNKVNQRLITCSNVQNFERMRSVGFVRNTALGKATINVVNKKKSAVESWLLVGLLAFQPVDPNGRRQSWACMLP